MKVYLSRQFQKDSKKDGISDEEYKEAINKAENGLIDAVLGGGLIKQRIAKNNRGAAKGFRAIVFYKPGSHAIFLHLFRKNEKANLSRVELELYRKFAEQLDTLDETKLADLLANGWRLLQS